MTRNRAGHFAIGELGGDFCAYHAHAIRRRLRRMGFGSADVDDLLQHAFVVAQHHWAQKPRGRGRERSWLEGIAWRLAMNLRRSRRRHRECFQVDLFDMHSNSNVDIDALLDAHRVFARVTEEWLSEDREMLFEYYVDGDSLTDIAARHGLARSTTWSRLQRLRQEMLDKIRRLMT